MDKVMAVFFSVTKSSGRLAHTRHARWLAATVLTLLTTSLMPVAHAAPSLPEIRLSQRNVVPGCVTPSRLMAFLKTRNGKLDPRFRDIASFYKQHGEAWGVRWDYAFFQMALETNFLSYRRPNGRMGDVDPRQNNFAGIGTTGGGVPGDSFPDVSTGVLGQIQHLVVYSGEMIPKPVAPRTQLKQEHILSGSRALNRPVRFSDLAKRWAADPKYAGSIEWIAERFRADYCKGRAEEAEVLPWLQEAPRSGADAGGSISRNVRHAKTSATNAPVKPRRTAAEPKKAAAKPVAIAPAPATVEATRTAARAQQHPVTPHAESDIKAGGETASRFALFNSPARLGDATAVGADRNAEAPTVVAGASVGGFLLSDKPAFRPPSGLGVKPGRCVVETARYGGETTVLLKSPQGADVHYVALSVLDGFEESMTKSFLASRPEGSEVMGTFASPDAALTKARTLCPE